jgi:peptidoglycan/xylan/chitin deacetylase (PgdA/CDA1 family)
MTSRITVFFRFDDYAESSPHAVEAGLVDSLRRHRMSMTFAVVPSITVGGYHEPGERASTPLSAEKIQFLREAVECGAVDAALHGWNHRTVVSTPPHSEFRGLSVDRQQEKIQQGQQAFRQWFEENPSVFVPPWNRYDSNTLEALARQDLNGISANRYGPSADGAIHFAPITADIRELRAAVEAAAASGDSDPIVGVLLHPYDFKESGDPRGDFSCEAFDADLQWLGLQPGVQVVSVSKLFRDNSTLNADRYRANQPWLLETVAPPFVRTTSNTPFFLTARGARRANILRNAAIVATHLVGLLAGLMFDQAASALLATMPQVLSIARYAAGTGLALVMARAIVRREIQFRPAFLVALLAGFLLSAIL